MGFKDTSTKRFAEGGKLKFSGLDKAIANRRITELDVAKSLNDLKALKSARPHKLNGALNNFWSIDINGRWRLIFRFEAGNAYDVSIFDTH